MTKNTKAQAAPREISVAELKQATGGHCVVRKGMVVCLQL